MRCALLLACLILIPANAYAEPMAILVEKTTAYGTISYPQILGLVDKAMEQSINNAIVKEAATWTCDTDSSAQPHRGNYNAASTLRLINNEYFSFTTQLDYFCGGAYPNNNMVSTNFDLKTGNIVPLDNLLVPEMQDAALTKFLISGHETEEVCMEEGTPITVAETYQPDAMDDSWDYYRTKDGITFFPHLPHVVQVCFREFFIPFEQVRPYLR